VRCYGQDTDPSGQFQFQVWRYRLWDTPNVFTPVTESKVSGYAWAAGKIIVEASVLPDVGTVDNAEFSYGLYVTIPKPSLKVKKPGFCLTSYADNRLASWIGSVPVSVVKKPGFSDRLLAHACR
jgi:hypothetical protein